jgi:hypothetical protein
MFQADGVDGPSSQGKRAQVLHFELVSQASVSAMNRREFKGRNIGVAVALLGGMGLMATLPYYLRSKYPNTVERDKLTGTVGRQEMKSQMDSFVDTINSTLLIWLCEPEFVDGPTRQRRADASESLFVERCIIHGASE